RRHRALNNVVDISVIAAGGAVAKLVDWCAGVNLSGELMDREIGPLARAINREISQGDDAEFVEMRKGRTKKLAGNFRGGIRAQRLSELFFFRKRDFLGGTIHRRTGCEDESFDAARLCCLKQVQGAADV